MTKKKPKTFDFQSAYGRLVAIEWIDSQTTYGWRTPESDDLPSKIKSVGFLVSDMKTCVTISSSISQGLRFAEKLTIPKAVIRRFRKFSLK